MPFPLVILGVYELAVLALGGASAIIATNFITSQQGQKSTAEALHRMEEMLGATADAMAEAASSAWDRVAGKDGAINIAQMSGEAEAGSKANANAESGASIDTCSTCGGGGDDDGGDGGGEEPLKKKKVKSSSKGEKIRTPDSHRGDFKDLGNRKFQNKHTKEIWTRERIGRDHAGEAWDVTVRHRGKPGGIRVGEVKMDGTIGRTW